MYTLFCMENYSPRTGLGPCQVLFVQAVVESPWHTLSLGNAPLMTSVEQSPRDGGTQAGK